MKFFNIFFFILLISIIFLSSCDDKRDSSLIANTVTQPVIVYGKIDYDTVSKAYFLYNSLVNPVLNPIKGFQGVPTIVYKEGILLAAWFGGKSGEELNQYIIVSSSQDMGNTWKENQLIIAPLQGSIRHFDPSLWLDKYENIHLSWTMSKGMWDGGIGGVFDIMLKLEGENITITKPERLFAGVMSVSPVHLDVDKSIMLFPVYGPSIDAGWFQGQYFAATMAAIRGPQLYSATYSTINKKINKPILLSKIPTVFPSTFDEHNIVSIGKDSILCLLRKNIDGLCTNLSINSGKTWEGEQKFRKIDGLLGSSRPCLIKLKSGNLLMIVNTSTKEREKLTAYLSKDKGKTWPYKLLIDERKGVSYPSAVQNSNDEICLIYDYNRFPNGRIMFSKFTASDIITGTTKPELVIISMVK